MGFGTAVTDTATAMDTDTIHVVPRMAHWLPWSGGTYIHSYATTNCATAVTITDRNKADLCERPP